ncbi:hypothetical protein B0H14DRAFT_2613707 [Mycena olivaceomarginata]|nr:hypothetical protein B0H14DRAFT_2613707 [Mycena olivaceomarginata]
MVVEIPCCEDLAFCTQNTPLLPGRGAGLIKFALSIVLCKSFFDTPIHRSITALPVGVIVGVSTTVVIVFIVGFAASFVLIRRRQHRQHGMDSEYLIAAPHWRGDADVEETEGETLRERIRLRACRLPKEREISALPAALEAILEDHVLDA